MIKRIFASRGLKVNSIASIAEQLALQFIQLLINVLIARELGAAAMGQYNGIMGLAGVVSGLAGMGLQSTLFRELSKSERKVPRYVSHAVLIRVLFSVPITVVVTLAVAYLFSIERERLGLVSLIALFNALISVVLLFYSIFMSLRFCVHYFVINISFRVLMLLASVLSIWAGLKLLGVVWVWVVLTVFVLCVFYLGIQHLTQAIPWRFDWRFGKVLILKSIPLSFASVAEFICIRADLVILLALMGADITGYYSIAVSIYLVVSLIPLTLGRVYQPYFIAHEQENARKAYWLLIRYVLMILGVAFILSGCLWGISPYAIHLIYGSEYDPAIEMLQWLAFVLPVITGGRCLSYVLISLRQAKRYFWNTFSGAAVNVTLNIAFIPVYGVYAAIATTFLSEALIFILSVFQVTSLRRASLMRSGIAVD